MTSEPDPLAGVEAEVPGIWRIGEFPEAIREALELGDESSVGISYPGSRVLEERIHEPLLAPLGAIHLIGQGTARVHTAFVVDQERDRITATREVPLRLVLAGSPDGFSLLAGETDETLRTVVEVVRTASARAPWLGLTIEHLLLALDLAGTTQGILDAAICLESLLRVNEEIAFRFRSILPYLASEDPAERMAVRDVLRLLYEARSQYVHGNEKRPVSVQRASDSREAINQAMRTCVEYVLGFMNSGGSTAEWQDHLGEILLGHQKRNYQWRQPASV